MATGRSPRRRRQRYQQRPPPPRKKYKRRAHKPEAAAPRKKLGRPRKASDATPPKKLGRPRKVKTEAQQPTTFKRMPATDKTSGPDLSDVKMRLRHKSHLPILQFIAEHGPTSTMVIRRELNVSKKDTDFLDGSRFVSGSSDDWSITDLGREIIRRKTGGAVADLEAEVASAPVAVGDKPTAPQLQVLTYIRDNYPVQTGVIINNLELDTKSVEFLHNCPWATKERLGWVLTDKGLEIFDE